MVYCGLCTAYVGKWIWPLFVKGLIMFILQKLFHGDIMEHLYGKATIKNFVATMLT